MPCLLVLMLLGLGAPVAHAEEVELRAASQVLRIDTHGALPVSWQSCERDCAAGDADRYMVRPGQGRMRWHSSDPALTEALTRLQYTARRREDAGQIILELVSVTEVNGRHLTQRYELSPTTRALRLRLEVPRGVALSLTSGGDFVPEPLPGFGATFSDVEPVRVSPGGQERIGSGAVRAGTGEWLGLRARFWTWLAEPAQATEVAVECVGEQRWRVLWQGGEGTLDLTFYAGPVQWQELGVVAPALTQMLFASLWEPLRWLCYGLYFLLGWISGWVANPGIAIILLSLAVKILLAPLTALADRWQQQVNRIQSRIQPRIAEIRSRHRGEEAHRLTLQVYRDAGVHPLFTLKSLAGFAIQVPMFIAAFDMLADNFALAGARFLWIDDLAAPDRFASLPVALPFFGAHFNLMPVAMTAVTLLSALTLRDATLTPGLLRKQQRQLYLMAGLFFLLFYTFPAGMVLYWTANNVWHLAKVQVGRWLGR